MYAIQGHVIHHTTDANCVSIEKRIDIPTFYLCETVQGIVSEEHALKIAKSIILPVELDYDSVLVYITATKV